MSAKELYRCTVDSCGATEMSACGLLNWGTCRQCGTGIMKRARSSIDGRLEVTHLPGGTVRVLARRGFDTITVTMTKDAATAFAKALLK